MKDKLKKYPFVAVHWTDACDHTEENLSTIVNKPTSHWYMERVTYGRLVKQDAHGVVICTDIDEDDVCEFTAVPTDFKPIILAKK